MDVENVTRVMSPLEGKMNGGPRGGEVILYFLRNPTFFIKY